MSVLELIKRIKAEAPEPAGSEAWCDWVVEFAYDNASPDVASLAVNEAYYQVITGDYHDKVL